MKSLQIRIARILENGKLDNYMSTATTALLMLKESKLEKKNKYEYEWILNQIEKWTKSMVSVDNAIKMIKPIGGE